MIRFDCPHCGKGLRAESNMAASAFNCPGCRGRVRVPAVGSDTSTPRRTASTSGRFAVHPYRPAGKFSGRRIARLALWTVIAAAIGGGIAALIALFTSAQEFSLIVLCAALGSAFVGFTIAQVMTVRPFCLRCKNWKETRSLGTTRRDVQSAKEALEAGDLPALGALSPEGDEIQVTVFVCSRCGRDGMIDVSFWQKSPVKVLTVITYPGAALPAFERLCSHEIAS